MNNSTQLNSTQLNSTQLNSTQLNSTQLADYVAQRFFVKQFFGGSLTVSVSGSFFAANETPWKAGVSLG